MRLRWQRHPSGSPSGRVQWPRVGTRTGLECRPPGKENDVAATVSWDQLRDLAGFRARKGCAISIFLGLDPAYAATAPELSTKINSLLDTAEKHDAAQRDRLTHEEREGLKADFERIRNFFDADFNRDGARGFALFCAGLDGVWRTLSLPEPVRDSVALGPTFSLAPLAPLVGRGDGAIVAVVGRERGELFRLRAGRLREVVDRTEEEPGRHDQGGWSQARYQRRVETLVFQEDAHRPAWECPKCGRASAEAGDCPVDGIPFERRDDGLDLALQRTLTHGGSAWAVRQHHDLEPVEGIAALLRF